MIRLRVERQQRGLTQTKLSALTGISPQDISALENGWRRPFPGWKERIARALSVRDADSLFEEVGTDEKTAAN